MRFRENPHFRTFSHIFVHFRTFSYIFVHFRTFSYIFVHFRKFSYIFLHFRTFYVLCNVRPLVRIYIPSSWPATHLWKHFVFVEIMCSNIGNIANVNAVDWTFIQKTGILEKIWQNLIRWNFHQWRIKMKKFQITDPMVWKEFKKFQIVLTSGSRNITRPATNYCKI